MKNRKLTKARKKIKLNEKKQLKKWPFLVIRNWRTGKPTEYSYLEDMPRGWKKCFGRMMCDELADAIKESGCKKTYGIDQVKEKYGSLRWYSHGGSELTDEVERKYEVISEYVCISCGREAEYTTLGWISPYCGKCIDKMKYTPKTEPIPSIPDSYKYSIYRPGQDKEEVTVNISDTVNKIKQQWTVRKVRDERRRIKNKGEK